MLLGVTLETDHYAQNYAGIGGSMPKIMPVKIFPAPL